MAERATIARPYAKAAFAAAREQGRLAEWSRWLGNARGVVLSEEFRLLERSPGVSAAQLEELIAGICGADLDAQGRALLGLLTENGRLDFLPEIAASSRNSRPRTRTWPTWRSSPRRPSASAEGAARGRPAHPPAPRRAVAMLGRSGVDRRRGGALGRPADRRLLKGKLERLETELTG
jgi:hypothetical protein